MVHAPLSHDLVVHLARARKAANLTQAELAERAGLSRMTVQRLESGNLDPRLSPLHELTANSKAAKADLCDWACVSCICVKSACSPLNTCGYSS